MESNFQFLALEGGQNSPLMYVPLFISICLRRNAPYKVYTPNYGQSTMLENEFKRRYDSSALHIQKKNATGKPPKFSENSQEARQFRLH